MTRFEFPSRTNWIACILGQDGNSEPKDIGSALLPDIGALNLTIGIVGSDRTTQHNEQLGLETIARDE